jgi:rubrerythrin
MNRGELLTRMFDAYDKKITPQRMYYYEEWAKTLPIESVKHIIDSAVKSFDYLPTVNKLYGLATLADSIDYKQRNVYFCFTCNGGFTAEDKKCPNCGEVSRD